jgi:predicted transport protein
MAAKVWAAPQLPVTILEAYRPLPAASNYSLADHPYLASGSTRDLFEAFRAETLSLNPCVVEEVLKLYVAYKAETNFVDMVPQSKALRLSLNVGFHEIDDPHGLCKDVSSVGRWGNGDVEVRLTKLDELPFVMALVRQSFERQMGNGAGT